MTINKTTADQQRQQRFIDVVKSAVCRRFGIPIEALNGKSRLAHTVAARHAAIYVIRQLCRAPYADLAAAFGKADHMSAVHSCRVVARKITVDNAFALSVIHVHDEATQYLPSHDQTAPLPQ